MLMEILSTVGTLAIYGGSIAVAAIVVAIPVNAIGYTWSKTKNYDESKNKAGHCW